MGFKSKQKVLTFSDLDKSFQKKNKIMDSLMDLDKATALDHIESILMKDYPVGQKKEGNKAYSPCTLKHSRELSKLTDRFWSHSEKRLMVRDSKTLKENRS